MGDDTEWTKLPTEEKCQHKAWKARVAGYEELIKVFQMLTDEKSPEFSKYLGHVKKFVVDSNVVAQEKGLEATLVFVENYFHAGKAAGEVCSGVVAKCLNQKLKIKDLGLAILMAFIEAEKQEIVQEELMKGLSNKQPKIVSACVTALRDALRDFGTKVISIKPILKQLQLLLEDRDKTVREETKLLAIEIYRWIGPALKPQLTNLKPLQMTELDAEFEKLPPSKPQQTRFLRSQQDLKAKMLEKAAAGVEDEADGAADSGIAVVEEVDAYELLDPVDILSKLPKDFYEKVEEKKWQDRKEVLEAVQKLAEAPKLEQGDYNDLVRSLKKVVSKDSNVMLVAIAAKCIALIATGLRKKFAPHAVGCIEVIIEKFKEKKTSVVQSLKESADACFSTTSLEAISETCIAALDHKTPTVKAETASYLARCFCRCTPVTLPKKLLKPFITALLKTANDTALEVREASFEALGTAMKVVTEKAIMSFLADVDSLKMTKIKECCEKATTVGRPAAAANNLAGDGAKQAVGSVKPGSTTASKPAGVTPARGLPKKQPDSTSASASSSSTSVAGAKKKTAAGKGKKGADARDEVVERELSDEAVDEKMASLFPGDTLPGLASANWKDRLASMERIAEVLKMLTKDDIPVQAFVRTIIKKPGLKDNNFQVLKLKVDLILTLAQRGNFSKRSADYCLNDMVDKIGDAKNGPAVQECLSNIAEATSLDYVAPQVLSFVFDQKNPKNQSEAINWLCTAIKQFGLKLNVKAMIETINKALASANPAVRTSGISLLGVIYMYMGPTLRVFFEKEKPTLLQQIDAEFEKVKDEKPPASTRGLKSIKDGGNDADDDDDGGGDDDGAAAAAGGFNPADLLPRVDISNKLTDAILTDLGDKNWKVRKEALEKIQGIVSDAKFITPNIESLPECLKQRLADSNKILGSMTIALCQQLATSMGPPIRQHLRSIVPGIISNFGDSKPHIRQSAVTALNTIMDQLGPTGMAAMVEGEMLLDALKIENPTLRAELLGWLAEKLPNSKKKLTEFNECTLILYACLEDRNADVRKKANDTVLPFMIHCGYDAMLQKVSLVKPVSKDVVMKALELARPNLPAKPSKSASATQASSANQQPPAAKVGGTKPASARPAVPEVTEDADFNGSNGASGGGGATKVKVVKPGGIPGTVQKKGVAPSVTSAASKKKQAEDEDTSPPMKVSNAKEQRMKDEKNLKVLKWNFDAPRKEFIDQLKMQMEPHFNKTMMDQLYHADFKFHIKAIDMLLKVCEGGMESTVANLDLILKWMTLRLFDTNTTVLMKCLEYLLIIFERLVVDNYHMTEMEANSFLPYLINRFGDPKDNIRRDIRNIIQLLAHIYPSSRIYLFLMEGLKSKNAKQRTECLDDIGSLIQLYGVGVCQPSPAVSLKLIAQQIGDRDNSVRSAALNTIVTAYELLGEAVYKFIGNLNDKDLSMLEERIKRSAKNKIPGAGTNQPFVQVRDPGVSQKQNSPDEKPRQSKLASASAGNFKVPETRQPVKGPFQLDFDDNSDNDETFSMPKLLEPDLNDINEPIKLPSSRYHPLSSATNRNLSNNAISSESKSTIQLLLSRVSSNDVNNSIHALHQIDLMLKDGKKALQVQNELDDLSSASDKSEALRGHVDHLLSACSLQLKLSYSNHMGQPNMHKDAIRLYKSVLGTILSLCKCKSLASEASRIIVKDLIQNLITVLLDSRLNETKEGAEVNHAVNITVVKIVENMDVNSVMSALIELLHEVIGTVTCSSQFLELVMKCLWKMIRMIPGMINQLNIDQVIGDIHSFLKAYPGPTWKNRSSDMPLRTLKTILHTLIKQKGDKILNHLSLVDGGGTSEVEQYIRRVLRSLVTSSETNENIFTESINSSSIISGKSDQEVVQKSHRISRSVQDSLAEIFKKIGCKETTNEGLNNLYDFKVKHPDADLEPFLKKSSAFFQEYINQGLKNIDMQRPQNKVVNGGMPVTSASKSHLNNTILSSHAQQPSSSTSGVLSSATTGLPPVESDLTAEQYLERLKFLRTKCGLDNSNFFVNIAKPSLSSISSLDSQSSPGIAFGKVGGDDVSLNPSATTSPFSLSAKVAHQKILGDIAQAQGDSPAIGAQIDKQSAAIKSAANLDELKKRLERIKNSGRE